MDEAFRAHTNIKALSLREVFAQIGVEKIFTTLVVNTIVLKLERYEPKSESIDLERLEALVDAENIGSQRVLEKHRWAYGGITFPLPPYKFMAPPLASVSVV
ncbi:uncharacterized protein LOC133293865 [Gastrolobium bilobum]|uniref:uncharacterized protein LOC133293865 n=1 Tax=Gastrolobium bilobum TaxID=150636 RepID=UPI002AB08050|nr:uncharacterized protein LOC133293865 [Gastrolobium bilobum]